MNVLCMHGVNCTHAIWKESKHYLSDIEIDYIDYPHEVLASVKTIDELANALIPYCKDIQYDAVIAHSMGGVLALKLLNDQKLFANLCILVETNLRPANPFYRNLLMEHHKGSDMDWFFTMMKEEAQYVHHHIYEELQEVFDYQDLVRQCQVPITIVYGDRGYCDYPNRFYDLCLDQDIEQQLLFAFIHDSCHMPMLENPHQFYNKMQDLLRKEGTYEGRRGSGVI